ETPVIAAFEMQRGDAPPIPSASAALTKFPLVATEPPILTRAAVVPKSEAPKPATLLSRADSLFSMGDVTSARLFYQRAADAGNGEAALRLAGTHDPSFLPLAKLFTGRGDPAVPDFWYSRARDLGAAIPPRNAELRTINRADKGVAPPSEPSARVIEPAVLLPRGDSLLNTGDVGAARLFYQRAADAGNGEA